MPPRFELTTLTNYSDEALIAEVHRVISELNGRILTRSLFDQLGLTHSATLERRFGTWRKALERAGVDPSIVPPAPVQVSEDLLRAEIRKFVAERKETPPIEAIAERLGVHRSSLSKKFNWSKLLADEGLAPRAVNKRYSDEDCFENLVTIWTHYGRQPLFSDLDKPPSNVGSGTYVRRFGSWRKSLARFVERMRSDEADTPIEEPALEERAPAATAEPVEPPQPRSLSLGLRYRILSRDRFRCTICGRSPATTPGVELHIDHIHPWSRGGRNGDENLRVLCLDCNLGKGARAET